MKRLLSLLLVLCLLNLPSPARAVDNVSNDEIKKLIDQLGDGAYAKREEAAKKLKAIGKPALPALKEALTSDDAEIVARAQALIRRIEIRPLPAGDPNGVNGLVQATRMRMSVVNGSRVLEVTEQGRDIKITDGPDGIVMSVTGLVGNERTTEEYTAKDAVQLKEENPEAYALFERWTGGIGAGMMIRGPVRIGGQIQFNGNFIQPMPIVPDELDLLRSRLDKQMREAKLKEAQRDEVNQALDKLVQARTDRLPNTGMEKYTEQCDELRKTLEGLKLDPGELLPPPAKTRLGVSVLAEEGRLFVRTVGDKSRAQRIGLKQGDEIRKIDGKEIDNVADLRKVVSAKEKGLVVEITRDGEEMKLQEKEEPAAADKAKVK